MAMDPIKDGGNWYQYCYSNPLRYWDPLGLVPAAARLQGGDGGFTPYGGCVGIPYISFTISGANGVNVDAVKDFAYNYIRVPGQNLVCSLLEVTGTLLQGLKYSSEVIGDTLRYLGYLLMLYGASGGTYSGPFTGGAGAMAGSAVAAVGFGTAIAGMILPLAGDVLAEVGTVLQSVGKNGKISPRPSKEGSGAGNWNKGSFDSPEDSLDYHYDRHGDEVGATSRDQYLRKAEEFAKTAKKGSTKSRVDGAVEGTIRYKKNGKYIDIAPDGSIVSFGKQ